MQAKGYPNQERGQQGQVEHEEKASKDSRQADALPVQNEDDGQP